MIHLSIKELEYQWVAHSPFRMNSPHIQEWYLEFEQDLKEGYNFSEVKIPHRFPSKQQYWKSILQLYRELVFDNPDNPVTAIENPLEVFWSNTLNKYATRKGNQRLCILRALGHTGTVSCNIINIDTLG